MKALSGDTAIAFANAVRIASVRPEVLRAIGNVYQCLQEAIDLRRPICESSGRCCRFETFGHRLYITTLEMARFLADSAGRSLAGGGADRCPFQVQKLCGVHSIRPFGCRIFFCDPTATDWQQDQYAAIHGELKRLHDALEVEYYYVEWREALAALQEPATGGG